MINDLYATIAKIIDYGRFRCWLAFFSNEVFQKIFCWNVAELVSDVQQSESVMCIIYICMCVCVCVCVTNIHK